MQRQGGGAIVNNASNAGLLPRAHDPVYSISKMALVAMTKSLAMCHSIDRIRVNCFANDPSIKSALKFLRKTQWARDKVEALYVQTFS